MRNLASVVSVMLLSAGLIGCEQLGIPNPEKEHAKKEAEGKAVGAACRHAGRAIEDCYTLNPKALKSAVFDGWKQMNDYMTEQKIEVLAPQLTEKAQEEVEKKRSKAAYSSDGFPPPEPFIRPAAPAGMGDSATEKSADKAGKSADKSSDKAAEKTSDKKPAKGDAAR